MGDDLRRWHSQLTTAHSEMELFGHMFLAAKLWDVIAELSEEIEQADAQAEQDNGG